MKRITALVLLLACAPLAYAQFAAGIGLSNGPDNNPNQAPGGGKDFVGSNSAYLQDTLHLGVFDIVPSYSFTLNSFAKASGSNYTTHLFDFLVMHPTLFMPRSVAQAVARAAAADSADDEESDDESADTVKDLLVARLHRIAAAVENGGFDTSTAVVPSTPSPADTSLKPGAPADTTGTDESGDEGDDDSTAAATPAPIDSISASTAAVSAAADTSGMDAIDSLQQYFADQFDAVADSLDNADGSEALKMWVERRVQTIATALVDSFPGDSTSLLIRDSVRVFITQLRAYVIPVDSTPAATVDEEEDTTIYAPLSLPRTSVFDWAQSDLTLQTTDDDTARYALELTGEYELRKDAAPGDSLGSHVASLDLMAHQAFTRAVNVFEEVNVASDNYAVLDTLNNTTATALIQGRWQPSPRFTLLAEGGFGYKHYLTQQYDTVTVYTKKLPQEGTRVVQATATNASQAIVGTGIFWRVWRPTTLGGTVFYLNNPANNARVSANTYFFRRYGANDLNDDRFTYTGTSAHLYFKQQIASDFECGLAYEHSARTYNQLAFKDVVKKIGKKLSIDTQVRTDQNRQDTYENAEFQIVKTFYFDDSWVSQFAIEALAGYTNNKSNDPNFKFHEGYATLNLSVDF